MKILGLDYGEARIGVAVSDAMGILASPLDTISEKDRARQLEKTAAVARDKATPKRPFLFFLPSLLTGS